MKPEHKEIMKARKRNIRLTVSYDGTAYNGFQRQNPPQIAVQKSCSRCVAILLSWRPLGGRMQEFMLWGR